MNLVKKDMRRAYRKEPTYPMLDKYDISSCRSEDEICCQMYKAGKNIFEICERLRRPQIEVAVMIMDQADKGKLKPRKTGIFGHE